MYKFKIREAEDIVREYLNENPCNALARKANEGDPASLMALYEKLCGDDEFDDGPKNDSEFLLFECMQHKYTPAMIRMADVEMCQGMEYWPDGLRILYEAMQLGDENAGGDICNAWNNCIRDWELEYESGGRLDRWQEFSIGFCYLRGIGSNKDESKGKRFLERSAKHHCVDAENLLKSLAE